MPIRFRCPHCTRLLGIARRKAGMQISCPQCTKLLTVPGEEEGDADLDEIDVLLNPSQASSPMPSYAPRHDPPKAAPPQSAPTKAERPQTSTVATNSTRPQVPMPLPKPVIHEPDPLPIPTPRPQPQRKPPTNRETPLLENDVDALLGMQKPGTKFELDEEPAPRKQPVSGMDAMSLMEEPRGLHLSPQKATLLAVAVVVLLGLAFAAGYMIASNT